MPALCVDDLRVDARLARHIDKIMVDIRSGQHILHNAAVRARAEAQRNTVAAQRFDRPRNIDALAARLQMAGCRTVELADHQRVFDALRAVKSGIERYRDNHGDALLKYIFLSFIFYRIGRAM